MPIAHPLNFILLVTTVPLAAVALALFEAFLEWAYFFHFDKVVKWISDRYGGGLGIANWWDPRIFDDQISQRVKNGLSNFDQPQLSRDALKKGRGFNIDIAETLLLMSAIVYERDEKRVREISKDLKRQSKDKQDSDPNFHRKLLESEARVHKQAAKWGLKFASSSELGFVGGSFAGLFWSTQHNFIIISFKGTTPTDFEDFLRDAMTDRVDAREFVFGEVHDGFYSSLFTRFEECDQETPYKIILESMRDDIAAKIHHANQGEKQPINVWVTGHSLGASIAVLFFTRLLKSPSDLNDDLILRDAYVFGAPVVGNTDFAADFTSLSNQPLDRPNNLWSIVDDSDIIANGLTGYDYHPTTRRFAHKFDLLNYMRVGVRIKLFQDGRRPKTSINILKDSKHESESKSWFATIFGRQTKVEQDRKDRGQETFLTRISHLPFPLFNHIPSRYFDAIQKARFYFEDKNVEE